MRRIMTRIWAVVANSAAAHGAADGAAGNRSAEVWVEHAFRDGTRRRMPHTIGIFLASAEAKIAKLENRRARRMARSMARYIMASNTAMTARDDAMALRRELSARTCVELIPAPILGPTQTNLMALAMAVGEYSFFYGIAGPSLGIGGESIVALAAIATAVAVSQVLLARAVANRLGTRLERVLAFAFLGGFVMAVGCARIVAFAQLGYSLSIEQVVGFTLFQAGLAAGTVALFSMGQGQQPTEYAHARRLAWLKKRASAAQSKLARAGAAVNAIIESHRAKIGFINAETQRLVSEYIAESAKAAQVPTDQHKLGWGLITAGALEHHAEPEPVPLRLPDQDEHSACGPPAEIGVLDPHRPTTHAARRPLVSARALILAALAGSILGGLPTGESHAQASWGDTLGHAMRVFDDRPLTVVVVVDVTGREQIDDWALYDAQFELLVEGLKRCDRFVIITADGRPASTTVPIADRRMPCTPFAFVDRTAVATAVDELRSAMLALKSRAGAEPATYLLDRFALAAEVFQADPRAHHVLVVMSDGIERSPIGQFHVAANLDDIAGLIDKLSPGRRSPLPGATVIMTGLRGVDVEHQRRLKEFYVQFLASAGANVDGSSVGRLPVAVNRR